jgi:hypothetical protein
LKIESGELKMKNYPHRLRAVGI